MLLRRAPERGQCDALGGGLGVDVGVDDRSIHGDHVSRGLSVLVHRLADGIRELAGIGGRSVLRQPQGIEVQETREVGVAPLLEPGRGHRSGFIDGPGIEAPLTQPGWIGFGDAFHSVAVQRLGDALCGSLDGRWLDNVRIGHQPTEPSISISMRRLSSTAYSSGSCFAMGSMKPRTMSAMASSWLIPRLLR